jgi:hypothetical protein
MFAILQISRAKRTRCGRRSMSWTILAAGLPGARWLAKSNRIKHSHRNGGCSRIHHPDHMKRRRPCTSCTKCRAPGYHISLTKGRCGRIVDGERCTGIIQSAVQVNDWAECPSCAGTGWEGDKTCSHCDGRSGWLFVRR